MVIPQPLQRVAEKAKSHRDAYGEHSLTTQAPLESCVITGSS